jgi:curli production assembly/transport component CsgE
MIDKDTTIREGKTLTIPEQPNLLLNANFLVADGQFEKLILRIFHNNELVATSQAFGPKPELPVAKNVAPPLPLSTEPQSLDGAEIGGLVLDETRSKLAHDFYELFYNGWTSVEEDIKVKYNISIREQPTGVGIGTRVLVELDGTEVLQLNLQPRLEIIENLAVQLVESLYTQIMNPDQSYQEINSDDISGSGIY